MSFPRRVVLVFFLIGLLTYLINLRENRSVFATPQLTQVGAFFGAVLIPIEKSLVAITSSLSGVWNGYFNLVGLRRDYEELKEKTALKDLFILSLKERVKNQEGLQYIEQEMDGLKIKGIPANVVAFDPYTSSQTVWISVGSTEGIKIDQPVMSLSGLVGRVVKVLAHSSQVLLITDPRFSVDVIDEQTRVRALVVGSGGGNALKRYPFMTHLEYLNLGDEINQGDSLITSGLGSIYPAGIPVGNVVQVQKGEDLFANSAVLPAVDISKLEQVFVIQ